MEKGTIQREISNDARRVYDALRALGYTTSEIDAIVFSPTKVKDLLKKDDSGGVVVPFLREGMFEITEYQTPGFGAQKVDVEDELIKIMTFLLDDLRVTRHSNGKPLKLTPSRIKLFKALFKEGYSPADVQMVHRNQWQEWGSDNKMRKHFTPETLYRPSNFQKYLENEGEWLLGAEAEDAADKLRGKMTTATKAAIDKLRKS